MDDLVETTPDKERAKSLIAMARLRLESVELMKKAGLEKFSSKIIEEYYESVLELVTAIMCIDGRKTRSDATGAHLASIAYMRTYSAGRHCTKETCAAPLVQSG
ncbi:MAG: hypothetical protein HY367_03505 [Candidatus Aenigmarchaeota archaeon]|nr:hypothetical protein [Candidatus Aenigmarchaeota archaeon]